MFLSNKIEDTVRYLLSSAVSLKDEKHELEMTQNLNLARQDRIQDVCDRYPPKIGLNELPQSELDHIIIDDERKLLYCYVPKVACTNWKRLLMILAGKWNGTDILAVPGHLAQAPGVFRELSNVTREERDYMLENYNKMIIVRNPFERLLSAYRNKFEGTTPSAKYFQERAGKLIIKAFRENPTAESLNNGDDVTFKEFALFVLNKSENLNNMVNNEHWTPITKLCHPCLINYTLVGKYETLHDDAQLALKTINVTNIQLPHLSRTSGTAEKLHSYFSQLDLPLIRELYKLFENDYRMFDYNLNNIVGFDLG
ncbi:unnamed protein product [Arctia plantaginis]|uniref:Carbohydrate sulfotransferase n=1 Tax=Arctia plantaginis TaxID=874455 RepID=A0A8S0ZCH2_ARCPL|nr:unnamed protein product [Arctia plantaginis]